MSQSTSLLMGAPAQALGYATSCVNDQWSVFNNIGGLSGVKHAAASFSYHAYPSFKNFNRLAAVVAVPTGLGVIGAGAFRFGDELYNEQIISAGFSNRFGIASLGVRLNYLQYQAEGFGSSHAVSIDLGGIADLTSQLSIGAYICNINQPKLTNTGEAEQVMPRLTTGISFKPSEKVFLTTEIEKSLDADVIWKTGVAYQFHQKFVFRTGFNVNPEAAFIGFGFKPKRFQIDYAVGYQPVLALHHQATITYQFSK